MSDGGFNAVVAREAFRAMGYELTYEFLPWRRAVSMAKTDPTVAGYFPEYMAEIEGFILSQAIGRGPLGLVTQAGRPMPDTTPEELATLKIGVVNGYLNAGPVAAAIELGLKPEGVTDDAANIRKVAAGRIDAAEIDRHVLAHLLRNHPDLVPLRDKVRYAATLEDETLHVAFADTGHGRAMAAAFAEGLATLDVEGLQKQYFAQAR